ncbi:MAG: AraC family transcriptional regulator [Prevotella sp.]|nr:AraC family transcriptional regulator [Prevotella sp.]
MRQLNQFTLKQLGELLWGDSNGQMLNNYISDNLVVAKNPPVARLLSTLSEDTYVLPEMRIMILTKGSANPTINLIPRHFEAGQAVFISHNSIVQFNDYSSDIQGFGISLTDELASLALGNALPKMLDGHVRDFNYRLAPHELQQLRELHTLLYNIMQAHQRHSQVILHLVSAFLWQTDQYWSQHESESRSSLTREQRLFTDFVRLVSQYAAQEHNIDFYAQRLFLSPRYMSTLVKQVSGKAAKQWIDDAIVTRIKVELRHSDKSAAQIADEMHFPNPSFFCKYFKRMTGMTTQEYRERRVGQH